MSGKDLALLGLFLVVGHFLHRALVYWRYRKVEAPLEAGAFAEEALRRYLTGGGGASTTWPWPPTRWGTPCSGGPGRSWCGTPRRP